MESTAIVAPFEVWKPNIDDVAEYVHCFGSEVEVAVPQERDVGVGEVACCVEDGVEVGGWVSSDEVNVGYTFLPKALHYEGELPAINYDAVGRVLGNVPVLAEDAAEDATSEEDCT